MPNLDYVLRHPIDLASRLKRSLTARHRALRVGLVGKEFGDFGRQLGWRLLLSRPGLGGSYLLTPVNHLRYFEFDSAYSCLRDSIGHCLDVASPRLFGLYVAAKNPAARVTFTNPDAADLRDTRAAIRALSLRNCNANVAAVDHLRGTDSVFDCVWSISVIEHVAGAYDDRDAMRWMFQALKPGGRLFVTVPVDRTHWEESRDHDPYGTQPSASGRYFFQRFYDHGSLASRLIDAVGREPVRTDWFGEVVAGRFEAYTKRWLRDGARATEEDPMEIALHYQSFRSWDEMPGVGVVGLLFERPR